MNLLYILTTAIVLAISGCTGAGSGTLTVQVTDLPGDIADFAHLNVTVTSIDVTMKDGSHESYSPSNATFDLTTLATGNLSTLFKDSVKAGEYTKLSLRVADGQGTLRADGTHVTVKAPGGTLSSEQKFTVDSGEETTFVFDIIVHMEGNGDYILQPNVTGIRVE
jgi:hypothetical protein